MKKTLLALALFAGPLAAFSAECNFRQPHSLACQKAAYEGQLSGIMGNDDFVLVPVPHWVDFWSPNQFTPATDEFKPLFTTLNDRFNRHRTCGIRNQNGNFIRAMDIRFSGPLGVHSIQFQGWSERNDVEISDWADIDRDSPLDEHTIIFSLKKEAELFRCRVFMRSRTQHLSCEFFKGGKFAGYLGFLPMHARPDCN